MASITTSGVKAMYKYGGTLKLFVQGHEVDSRTFSCPSTRSEIFLKYHDFAKGKENCFIDLIPNLEYSNQK